LINQQQLQPGRTAFNDQKKLFEHPMAIKVLEVCMELEEAWQDWEGLFVLH